MSSRETDAKRPARGVSNRASFRDGGPRSARPTLRSSSRLVLRKPSSASANHSLATEPKDVEAGFYPAAASPHEAMKRLRTAMGRLTEERMTAHHPILGKLTHEIWPRLHLRHAELHLGFAVPGRFEGMDAWKIGKR
jgi:hypothetical protein